MSIRRHGITLLTIVGLAFAMTADAGTRQAASRNGSQNRAEADIQMVSSHDYTKHEVEFYLGDEEKNYVRPGLTVEIVGVDIPADRYPVVEVTFVDDQGQPLDRAGIMTPGTISMSFVIAWYDAVNRHYTAYTTRANRAFSFR